HEAAAPPARGRSRPIAVRPLPAIMPAPVRGLPPLPVMDKELGMADERIGVPESEERTYWAWTELFRTFQVALDPKKLLLAAVGIVAMWLGVLARSWVCF